MLTTNISIQSIQTICCASLICSARMAAIGIIADEVDIECFLMSAILLHKTCPPRK